MPHQSLNRCPLAAADGIVSSEEQGSVEADPLKPPEEGLVREALDTVDVKEELLQTCR